MERKKQKKRTIHTKHTKICATSLRLAEGNGEGKNTEGHREGRGKKRKRGLNTLNTRKYAQLG
jgi:hypothetical protein